MAESDGSSAVQCGAVQPVWRLVQDHPLGMGNSTVLLPVGVWQGRETTQLDVL